MLKFMYTYFVREEMGQKLAGNDLTKKWLVPVQLIAFGKQTVGLVGGLLMVTVSYSWVLSNSRWT
jgi:hypothetical protein